MTHNEAALNLKMVSRTTTEILCPNCLGEKLGLSADTLRSMIDVFREQGCILFSPAKTD